MSVTETCQYFMWRQAFPVKIENKVSARRDIEEWIITLAFPCGQRLTRGTTFVGIYAFLPTAMITDFPFAIQADFILASSRETIVFDNKWNLGILECVPTAFSNAFESCVKEISPSLFSVVQAFEFLPVRNSPFPELNKVRESIKAKLQGLNVISCSDFRDENFFHRSSAVIRIHREFRELLYQLKSEGVPLDGLYSLEMYVLKSCLDHKKYDALLEFLGLASADCSYQWCAKCITACNLALLSSENAYIALLHFIAQSNQDCFWHIPLLKYINQEGNIELCTLTTIKRQSVKVQYAIRDELLEWLNKCNMEFGCPNNNFLLPNSTQKALVRSDRWNFFRSWLSLDAAVKSCSALGYGCSLIDLIRDKQDSKLAIRLAQFVYHSNGSNFMQDFEVSQICERIPVIDGTRHLRIRRIATLVPASGSKWAKLLGPINPFVDHDYIDLGNIYSESGQFAGKCTPEKALLSFLSKHCKAVDIEKLVLPNVALQVASSGLTSEQAFLLLDWIRCARSRSSSLPQKFVDSVQVGKWLKTLSGFSSPSQSILPDVTAKVIFDMMKNFMGDFAIIDQQFYMNKIGLYEDELKFLGVSFSSDDIQELVIDRSWSRASAGMSKESAFSLLMFLGCLKARNTLDEEWLTVVKEGKWLVTSQGYSAPMNSVLLPSELEAQAVVSITNLPIIDECFYGSKIASFASELVLLGVVSDIEKVSKLIAENMFLNLSSTNSACGLLILKCIRYSGSSSNVLIENIRNKPWLKTCCGTKCPIECILPDSGWSCLSSGIGACFIDETFYGDEIRCFKAELKAVGVTIEFGSAVKMIGALVTSLASSSQLTPSEVISLLKSIRLLNTTMPSYACELCHHLSGEEWLQTRHGYRAPSQSILFNSKWGTISLFIDLPLIDDSFYGLSIYGFKAELKLMSVVTDFEGGARFVAGGLKCPIESSLVTAECTISLLECIRIMPSTSQDDHVLDDFISNLKSSKWLKTSHGFQTPDKCILQDAAWDNILQPTDAPVIDEKFYETDVSLYKNELKTIGVKVDCGDVCSFLFGHVLSLAETSMIERICCFLSKFHWTPNAVDACNCQVWIPDKAGGGKWVNSQLCIVYDRYNIFDGHLYALDKYYSKDLLPIFSSAFGVAEFPCLDSYLKLWHNWVSSSEHHVTVLECCVFWGYVIYNWNSCTQEILRHSLTQVPATVSSGEEIFVARKEEVFIPDDLRLAEAFSSDTEVQIPLFAWLPKSTTSPFVSPRRLADIYINLGVRRISESILCTPTLPSNYLRRFEERNALLGKGLIKIILCFLASPESRMPKTRRQKAAKSICDLSVYESDDLIQLSYSLATESMPLEVEVKRMVFWEKKHKCLIIYRLGYVCRKINVEFGSSFAQEIAEGLLAPERSHLVDNLRNLIQVAFMFDFSDDAVDFLLRRANLKLCEEDEEFLSTEFSCAGESAHVHRKRTLSNLQILAPSMPAPSCKKQSK